MAGLEPLHETPLSCLPASDEGRAFSVSSAGIEAVDAEAVGKADL